MILQLPLYSLHGDHFIVVATLMVDIMVACQAKMVSNRTFAPLVVDIVLVIIAILAYLRI